MPNNNLPFPRGSTYWGGDTSRVTSANITRLIGRVFEVNDREVGINDTTHGNGTSQTVKLRVCKNSSGGNLTRAKGVAFSTLSAAFGGVVTSALGTVSIYGEVIDDYHSTTESIISNDLFYTVVEGPVKTKMATHAVTITVLTVGTTMSFDAKGHLVDSVAGAINIATAHEHVQGTATGQFRRVFIGGNFNNKQ